MGVLMGVFLIGFFSITADAAVFVVNNADDHGSGSFRQAIEDANNLPGMDEIRFMIPDDPLIPGFEVHRIVLDSPLPSVYDSVKIDAVTDQPGASCGPRELKVEIDASQVPGDDTWDFFHTFSNDSSASGSSIKGLAFYGFFNVLAFQEVQDIEIVCSNLGTSGDGLAPHGNENLAVLLNRVKKIRIGGAGELGNIISANQFQGIQVLVTEDAVIENNLIGTDATGQEAFANGIGIKVTSASGGQMTKDVLIKGNLISGNRVWALEVGGVHDDPDSTVGVRVQGNKIGTDISGTQALPNGSHGIFLSHGRDVLIGGDSPAERNIISGNGKKGVNVFGYNFSGLVIKNNYIGTDISGTQPVGNQHEGVYLNNSKDALIQDNLIAFNVQDGISAVNDTEKNTIIENSIHSNEELGIDLNNDGVTQNDSGDTDAGPNDLLNFPEIIYAEIDGDELKVRFSLDVDAQTMRKYRVEFFDNPSGFDPTGFGEGQRYLGFGNVVVDPVSPVAYAVSIPIPASIDPQSVNNITATTTEYNGNRRKPLGATSEFSAGFEIKKFYDYGDAPDPENGTSIANYRTREEDSGASHRISAEGPYLGNCIDVDPGYHQGLSASDDDESVSAVVFGICKGGDDEDGVNFSEVMVPGFSYAVSVHGVGSGLVKGWIDWNQDGDWDDDGELVVSGLSLSGQSAWVNVPSDAMYGPTYARFRTVEGNVDFLKPTGSYDQPGEVEDYKIEIIASAEEKPGAGKEEETIKWEPVKNRK